MRSKEKLSKMVGVNVSEEIYELLDLFTHRDGIPVAKFIRNLIEQELQKLKALEENHWKTLPEKEFNEILKSLQEYLRKKYSYIDGIYTCGFDHRHWDNTGDIFKYTKEFCKETDIEFNSFKKRLEECEDGWIICECELANKEISTDAETVNMPN